MACRAMYHHPRTDRLAMGMQLTPFDHLDLRGIELGMKLCRCTILMMDKQLPWDIDTERKTAKVHFRGLIADACWCHHFRVVTRVVKGLEMEDASGNSLLRRWASEPEWVKVLKLFFDTIGRHEKSYADFAFGGAPDGSSEVLKKAAERMSLIMVSADVVHLGEGTDWNDEIVSSCERDTSRDRIEMKRISFD
ncbi:HpcH/HpaI aldolase/citrate lyase family protein [Colletotrichum cuscutae]|uniref:HpcH/HpaI aldolase/citrate lyase family protein n=1 Tax=Colletotrichum cuscutae TaxID=1209917 RepID=A0AAI9Y692_9PEZI|nr:HpcH/HpaI aldolase/citrate lyase family protein [Colletotrichum cuscutae]